MFKLCVSTVCVCVCVGIMKVIFSVLQVKAGAVAPAVLIVSNKLLVEAGAVRSGGARSIRCITAVDALNTTCTE